MIGINYLSNFIIPFTIFFILIVGLLEKNKVFDTFLKGATEGVEITCKLFPTLVGVFVAIGTLRYSGILDYIIRTCFPVIRLIGIPQEILPLAILKPISRQCCYCGWK